MHLSVIWRNAGLALNFEMMCVLCEFQVLLATSTKMAVFRDVEPCSLIDTDRCSRIAYCLDHHTLMMEAISSSEMSVRIYQATQCNISEDDHVQCVY
jgi:hypothetical protein